MLVNMRQSDRGFTIFELMVVLAIAAILVVVAVPSFTSILAMMRVKTLAGEIQSALTNARSESMKRNASVSVTPAASGWQGGWTVITAVAGTPSTIQQRDAMTTGARLLTTTP